MANKFKEFKDALDALIEIHKEGVSLTDIALALEDAHDDVEAEADEAKAEQDQKDSD